MYYVQTKRPLLSIKGKIALAAQDVLSFIEQAKRAGFEVDVTDKQGNRIVVEDLRKKLACRGGLR
jgi:hypothetical protein